MATQQSSNPVPSNKVSLKVKSVSGEECKYIPLDIKVANADTVVIKGIPGDAYLDSGTKNAQGAWELDPSALMSVQMMPPPNYSGKLELVVEASRVSTAGDTHTASEKLEVTVEAEDEQQKCQEEFTPATLRQKVWLGMSLILSTAVVIVVWFYLFNDYSQMTSKEANVKFKLPDSYVLRSGPVEFRYDADPGGERLIHIGPIDNDRKTLLVGLLSKLENTQTDENEIAKKEKEEKGGNKPQAFANKEESMYWSAIDRLTFKSHSEKSEVLKFLLLLAGLSGILGVQVRSIINFIGITCIKNSLDFKRWWPWYILRPVQGFMLGLLAVLIIKAGIFIPDGSVPSGTNWWMAITILVGFGADDFTERLRLVSQALFGKKK